MADEAKGTQVPMKFEINRYDSLREYDAVAMSCTATLKALDSYDEDKVDSKHYTELNADALSKRGWEGPAYSFSLETRGKNNFTGKVRTNYMLTKKLDVLKLVSDVADDLLSPGHDEIVAAQPNTVTKWFYDKDAKVMFVETSRLKGTLSGPQVDSEKRIVEKALDAITSLADEMS